MLHSTRAKARHHDVMFVCIGIGATHTVVIKRSSNRDYMEMATKREREESEARNHQAIRSVTTR